MSAATQAWAWTKNMAGATLTEPEMQTIPYPAFELYTHVTFKTVQAGSLIGGFMIGPLYRLLKSNSAAAVRSARWMGPKGMAVGLVLGPIMTYGRVTSAKVDHDGYFDRSYRLRHNVGQMNADRASMVLGAVGLLYSGLPGASVGINIGTILAGVYTNLVKPKLEGKKKEKKEEPKPEVKNDPGSADTMKEVPKKS